MKEVWRLWRRNMSVIQICVGDWRSTNGEQEYDHNHMPAFMTPEDSRAIFESGKSLQILKKHHPEHPLARPGLVPGVESADFSWHYSWEDVERVEAKAREYKENLAMAIKQYKQHGYDKIVEVATPEPLFNGFETFGCSKSNIQASISNSLVLFSKPLLPTTEQTHDNLRSLVNVVLRGDDPPPPSIFAPPIALVPLLSFSPLISAQASIVAASCTRLFFREHKLRAHLSLLRRFQLCGDGVFISRLSHALFDPELETAERQQGISRLGGTMGLRLGSRESWPPASSELRLALMGILTESYFTSAHDEAERHITGHHLPGSDQLPGGLSFAVREMGDEADLERILDPNNIEALDFLRIQYKAPAPLDSIITPSALLKYDQLFKFILRLLRMLFAVNQLFRDATDRTSRWQGIDPVAQKFRMEAHHFVNSVSSYIFEVGVGHFWGILEKKLDSIDATITRNDNAAGGFEKDVEGIERIRAYHDLTLDSILFASLLRKRQEPVMKLLTDIFSSILLFCRYSRLRALGVERKLGEDEEVKVMYGKFRKRVGVFVGVCRGLSEKRGYGADGGEKGVDGVREGLFGHDRLKDVGGTTIGQLVLKLEMSEYYSGIV
jgi:Gamma tubulin complex component C-terminal